VLDGNRLVEVLDKCEGIGKPGCLQKTLAYLIMRARNIVIKACSAGGARAKQKCVPSRHNLGVYS